MMRARSPSLQLRHHVDAVDYLAVARRYRALAVRRLRGAVQHGDGEVESDTFLAAALALLLNDVSDSGGADQHQVFAAGTSWREVWRYALLAIRRRGGPQHILFGTGRPSALQRCLIGHAAFWDFVGAHSRLLC